MRLSFHLPFEWLCVLEMAREQTGQLFCQLGVIFLVLPANPYQEILAKEGRWPERVLV